MKKHCILIPLLSFSLLAGCQTFTKKNLTVESVRDTLRTIDDSLTYFNVDSTDYDTNLGNGYAEIYGEFTSQDYAGTYPKAFNYNDEPYLQFRFVKNLLDSKEDFVFGKKYYNDIDKNVYFDFTTGKKDEDSNPTNKVTCATLVGTEIKVNSFRQIFINIAFHNNYTLSNGVTFSTNRYVCFMIDYEYEKEGTNFLFKAYTRNDELNAPYIGYITYQHDYIRIKDGNLVEYRQFNIETNKELSIDEYHVSFDDYINTSFAYRVDAVKWYVDGVYNVSKYMSAEKQNFIGNQLFSLGMFEPLSYAEFLSDIEDNEEVDTYSAYSYVSNAYGDDIQYAFLTKNPSTIEHINEKNNPYYNPEAMQLNKVIGIEVCNADGSDIPTYSVLGSVKIRSLFQGFTAQSPVNRTVSIPVWYVSENGPTEQISAYNLINTSKFTLYFVPMNKDGNGIGIVDINSSNTIKEAYEKARDTLNISTSTTSKNFSIVIKEVATGNLCEAQLTFGESLSFLDEGLDFPQVLVDYGVPKYTGTEVSRYKMEDTDKYENGYGCYICGEDIFNYSAYISILRQKGFSCYKLTTDDSGNALALYYKVMDANTYLFVKLSYAGLVNDYQAYLLRAYQVLYSDKSNLSSSFPSFLVAAGLPTYRSSTATFDDQTDTLGLFIYNSNYSEVTQYFSDLVDAGFTVEEYNYLDGIIKFMSYTDDGRYIIHIRIFYYERENNDYFAMFTYENNPDYFDIDSVYLTSYFDTWNSTYASNSIKLVQASTYFRLDMQRFCSAGKKFKFIANENWHLSNKSTSYNGFGYDDVTNMSSYSEYFSRGSNGEIIVTQNIMLMVYFRVFTDRVEIVLEVTPVGVM